jgi:hypothetical protein
LSEITTTTIYARYTFSDKELLELSRKMGQAALEKKSKEDELKSISSSIKASITTQDGIINENAEKVRSGYEMRAHTCSPKYDIKNKVTTYIDVTSGEIIETRPMTENEQLRLSKIAS